MTALFQISNFKLQTSNKFQTSNFNFCYLLFGVSLIFDLWFLRFASEGGLG